MTIDELKDKRQALMDEIEGASEERFAEIKDEISKLDFEIDDAKKNERSKSEETQEEQEEELRAARVPNGTSEDKVILFNNETKKEARQMTEEEKRQATITELGKQFRDAAASKEPKEINIRAVGEAVTTTDTEYVAPTEAVDGTNNGGVFIPTSTLFDLLGETETASPIYDGVSKTSFKGVLIFPYRKNRTANSVTKKEREKVDELSIEWDNLKLADGDYALSAGITFEILDQADYALGDYLVAQLREVVRDTIIPDVIYGEGANEHIAGIVENAIEATYTAGDEIDAIKAALNGLPRKYQAGAKLYVSTSLYNELSFKTDANDRPLYPLFNEGTIMSVAGVEIVKDPYLNDGDFIYGNPTHYHLNEQSPATLYSETHGRYKIVEYTLHEMIAGRAEPQAFYYAKAVAATKTSTKANTETNDEGK